MKNKKGFTLIELLAVIVILAILLAIAIPQVSKYITRSRKDSLIATAKDFVSAVRTDFMSEIYEYPIGTNEISIVSLDLIKLTKGGEKSPFAGKWIPKYSYVAVINTGSDLDPDYQFYIAIRDSKRYTITLSTENKLTRDSIVRNNTSFTKAPVDAMCGSREGTYKIIDKITGLEKYNPQGGWHATVYSSVDC